MDKWRYRTYHNMYVDIAVEHYNIAQNAYIQLMNLKESDLINGDTLPLELFETVKKNAITTICFSVMALESYINTAVAGYFNPSIAQAVDRLDLVSKWITAMYIATSIELERGKAPLQRLIKTVKYRNNFVHNKSANAEVLCDGVFPSVAIPELHPKNDFMTPAYDALLAIRDMALWVGCNWTDCSLWLWNQNYDLNVQPKFKEVQNIWTFTEDYSILCDYDYYKKIYNETCSRCDT